MAHRPKFFQSKWLQRLDVGRLQALGAANDFEFNRLAVVERLIAISHNRGEMDENVLTALALDESKALAGVKPLHCSLFFAHCCVSFQELSYLVLRYVLAADEAVQNKKAARVTLRTFTNFQRRYKSNKRNTKVPRGRGGKQAKSYEEMRRIREVVAKSFYINVIPVRGGTRGADLPIQFLNIDMPFFMDSCLIPAVPGR